MKKLNIYVWDDVLEDWTPGCLIVVATSVEEAKQIAYAQGYPDSSYSQLHDNPKVLSTTKKQLVHYQYGGA